MSRKLICFALMARAVMAQSNNPDANAGYAQLSIEQLLNIQVENGQLEETEPRRCPRRCNGDPGRGDPAVRLSHAGRGTGECAGFSTQPRTEPSNTSACAGFRCWADYNTRFLVMINGHQMTDNIYGAMYMFGQGLRIGHGPGGANRDRTRAVPRLCTAATERLRPSISSPKTAGATIEPELSAEGGSFGETKFRTTATFRVGRTGKGLVSGSGFHTGGRSLVLTTLDDPPQAYRIGGAEKSRATTRSPRFRGTGGNVTALFGQRRIAVPTGYFGGDLGGHRHQEPGIQELRGGRVETSHRTRQSREVAHLLRSVPLRRHVQLPRIVRVSEFGWRGGRLDRKPIPLPTGFHAHWIRDSWRGNQC